MGKALGAQHGRREQIVALSLGFAKGQVVQEFYADNDSDEALQKIVEAETGSQPVDPDYGDVVDGALIWWRSDDAEEEDLTDVLVDAVSNLDNGGLIWVLIPKPGRPGELPIADVEEAARTAGLHSTSAASASRDWIGIRLTARPPQR